MSEGEKKPGSVIDAREGYGKYEVEIIDNDWGMAIVPAESWRRMEWQEELIRRDQSSDPADIKQRWATVQYGRSDEARYHIIPRTEIARRFVDLIGDKNLSWLGFGYPVGEIRDPSSGDWVSAVRLSVGPRKEIEPVIKVLQIDLGKYKREPQPN